jgi:hypothetical protein
VAGDRVNLDVATRAASVIFQLPAERRRRHGQQPECPHGHDARRDPV